MWRKSICFKFKSFVRYAPFLSPTFGPIWTIQLFMMLLMFVCALFYCINYEAFDQYTIWPGNHKKMSVMDKKLNICEIVTLTSLCRILNRNKAVVFIPRFVCNVRWIFQTLIFFFHFPAIFFSELLKVNRFT